MEILSIIIIITIIIIKIAQLQRNIKECPYCKSKINKNAINKKNMQENCFIENCVRYIKC